MAINLENIEDKLKTEFGMLGVEYLFPQLDIIRTARNLPSKIESYKLVTQRFYESYQLIQKWIAPVIVPITEELSTVKKELRDLQDQVNISIQEDGLKFWKDVETSSNATISTLYPQIVKLRDYILDQQEKLLQTAHRQEITELFGLVSWPYSKYLSINDVTQVVKEHYFGENTYYRKNNMLTDAIMLIEACKDALKEERQAKQSFRQIDELVINRLSFRTLSEQLEWTKYQKDTSMGIFTEGQVRTILRILMPNLTSAEIFQILKDFYDPSQDNYPIGRFLEWVSDTLRNRARTDVEKVYKTTKIKDYIIGLSFMDKHRRQEILGNISDLGSTFERILAPFHELKQDNVFMQSAQFELENVAGLPSQAWLYDYTGVETEILRSTLLLISDRNPKFDVLEACQRLANIVLSGRVDRQRG